MIKFLDLHKINNRFENDLNTAFARFLASGYYILGDETKHFEEEYAAYCGVKYCIGVSNGLDAIRLIFEGYKALGYLEDGDEVLVPSNTYIASILAISQAGLVPVLVEPDADTFNIDPTFVSAKISLKTKAILVVHLYGQVANMDLLTQIAQSNNLLLIDDAAQAHGAKNAKGDRVGSLCDASAFSFYPTKNLGALGDGGAVTTNNIALYQAILKLRNYGTVSKYVNEVKGFNCRLDEVQAAFLSLKLPFLDADNAYRQQIAKRYITEISNPKIKLPLYNEDAGHVFHLFVIRTLQRNELQEYLEKNGIQTMVHYPIPPHQQHAYREWNHLSFPISEQLHSEVLSLPISPVITKDEVDKVISVINAF